MDISIPSASASTSPSAVPSEIFAFLSLLVISIVVLLILRHYLPLRTTPGYLLVPVFLAIALPASIVLLVPIDLASHARADGADDGGARGVWLPDRVLLVAWRITYWLTFALTWYVLEMPLFPFYDLGWFGWEGGLGWRRNAKKPRVEIDGWMVASP